MLSKSDQRSNRKNIKPLFPSSQSPQISRVWYSEMQYIRRLQKLEKALGARPVALHVINFKPAIGKKAKQRTHL